AWLTYTALSEVAEALLSASPATPCGRKVCRGNTGVRTGDHDRGDAPLPRLDGVVHRSMYSTAGEGSRLLMTEWRFSESVVLERQGKTSRGRGPYAKESTSKGASGPFCRSALACPRKHLF